MIRPIRHRLKGRGQTHILYACSTTAGSGVKDGLGKPAYLFYGYPGAHQKGPPVLTGIRSDGAPKKASSKTER